ncbi:MAG TPA: hypothetical protein VGI78_29645 [Acetobacteraceae bacterium]
MIQGYAWHLGCLITAAKSYWNRDEVRAVAKRWPDSRRPGRPARVARLLKTLAPGDVVVAGRRCDARGTGEELQRRQEHDFEATRRRRNEQIYTYAAGEVMDGLMGQRNYLIEGVSGAGKTAVCTELQRRGYQAVHGDRELVYRGDPETGLPTAPETDTPTAAWMSEHHIWDVEKVQALVANQEEALTFFCGGSRNVAKFIDLFDGVLVLEVDLDTMKRRIDERVALDPSDFGGTPEERELAVRLHQTKEAIPKNGIIIDATRPLEHVVDEILARTRAVD